MRGGRQGCNTGTGTSRGSAGRGGPTGVTSRAESSAGGGGREEDTVTTAGHALDDEEGQADQAGTSETVVHVLVYCKTSRCIIEVPLEQH